MVHLGSFWLAQSCGSAIIARGSKMVWQKTHRTHRGPIRQLLWRPTVSPMGTSGGFTRHVRPVNGSSADKQNASMAAERMLTAVADNDAVIDHEVIAAGTIARGEPRPASCKGVEWMPARIGLLGSYLKTRVNHWSGLSLYSCALSEWRSME